MFGGEPAATHEPAPLRQLYATAGFSCHIYSLITRAVLGIAVVSLAEEGLLFTIWRELYSGSRGVYHAKPTS